MLRVSVLSLLAVTACSSSPTVSPDGREFGAQLQEGAEMRASLSGSNLSVSIHNSSDRPVCIWTNQWLDGNVHLIRVTERGRSRPFMQEMPSHVGGDDRPIPIGPKSSIATEIDLEPYYDVRAWSDVEIEYSPVIVSCEYTGQP